jgi:hypothetical protein
MVVNPAPLTTQEFSLIASVGNGVETQTDNFDTASECLAFAESEKFAENPIGVDFDPEEFVARVRKVTSGGDNRHSRHLLTLVFFGMTGRRPKLA